MSKSNISSFDLNLLLIFDALMKERSVTRAGLMLGMSQPSVSAALRRLRADIGDPLFVKTRTGMEPTRYAVALHPSITQGLAMLKSGLLGSSPFDPALESRDFKLLLSDIGQVLYLPRLMMRLRNLAPLSTITVVQVPRDRYRDSLESGEVDLALGYLPQLGSTFYQRRILQDTFVCLASNAHPRIGKKISLKRFCAESHIAIAPSGVAPNLLEQTLQSLRIRREVVLKIPSFLAAPPIVRDTELLASVPSMTVKAMSPVAGVRQMPLPFATPFFTVNQYWHQRQHNDKGNQWLRNLISEVMQEAFEGLS